MQTFFIYVKQKIFSNNATRIQRSNIRMNARIKKVLAIVLATIMVLSCSMTAFAEETRKLVVLESVDNFSFLDYDTDYIINGDVYEGGINNNSSKLNSTVTVTGNVENTIGMSFRDIGTAVNATQNVIVSIEKDVVSKAENGISAAHTARVTVGGDVTTKNNSSWAISARDDSIVIVEGTVNGNVNAGGQVYLGELNGDIDDSNIDKVHYLIGTADGQNNKISVVGEIISTDTIDGVKNEDYYCTTTADSATLSGKSFLIKSTVGDKKMKIEGEYDNVTITPNDDGTYTLTLGEDFKGGIQALNVIFEDIARKISSGGGSSKPLYTGTWDNPVTNGNWHYDEATDKWSYSTTYKFTDTWGCIANPYANNEPAWFYFDRNGNMLTGWHWLYWNGTKRCYYFNPSKDTKRGKCQLGGVTPDGYTVDETGAWTVNGVVQTK